MFGFETDHVYMNLGNGKRISDCDEHDRSCHWCQRGAPACFTADAVVPARPPCTIQASDVSRPPYPQTEFPMRKELIFFAVVSYFGSSWVILMELF